MPDTNKTRLKTARTDVLEIAYEESGPASGPTVFLMHGFPDDVRTWDGTAPLLAQEGFRVIVPYLRGYGPTKFLKPDTLRSGQQAALGHDLRQLMDALDIERAGLAGYDWGGRACCVTAALWPERVIGLVSMGVGYNIQNIPRALEPAPAAVEHLFWYQWYFNTERGRAGLAANRRDICRTLWQMWSPTWSFDEATFEATARSFDNPDFVDVVIQSYRHRQQNAAGDPALRPLEQALTLQPKITVPTILMTGAASGLDGGRGGFDRARPLFTRIVRTELVADAGHLLPRQAGAEIARAVQELMRSGQRE
jgi:pimeloyl-ACP methyl ester carboxylesterase